MKARRLTVPATGNRSLPVERPTAATDLVALTLRSTVAELNSLEQQTRAAGMDRRPAVRRPELLLGNTARVIPYVGNISVRRARTARPPERTQVYDEVPKITPSKAQRTHRPLSLEYQQPPVDIPIGQVMERIVVQRPEREQRQRRELLNRIGSGLGICLARCIEQDARARDLAAAKSPQLIADNIAEKNEPAAAAALETVEWPTVELTGESSELDDRSLELDGNFSGKLDLGAVAAAEPSPVRPSADIRTLTPDQVFGDTAMDYASPVGSPSLFQPLVPASAP